MRYLWELSPGYLYDWTHSGFKRDIMRPLATQLRVWHYATAARVDQFAANSENVRRRIEKTYRRESVVIHPPVAVQNFSHKDSAGYFLTVSELVSYKQLDYAVRVISRAGRALNIAGDGPGYRAVKQHASSAV